MKKLFYLIFFSCYYFAQSQNPGEIGSPIIRYFDLLEYKAASQNWAITQDLRGIMYFGNNSGVLEYDGINWRLIPVTNNGCVRSLDVNEKGQVFVGASGDFGFLKPSKIGKLVFQSLLGRLNKSMYNFSDVWEVICNHYGVYFVTSKNVFLYDYDTVVNVFTSSSFPYPFKVNNSIIMAHEKLTLLVGTRSFDLPHSEFKPYNGDPVIMEYNANQILVVNNKQCFTYDLSKISLTDSTCNYKILKNDIIKEINLDFKDFFKDNKVYCAQKIDDITFALGTIPGGILFFNKNGKELQLINKNRGLRNNTVLKLFLDRSKNLWVCLDNGLACIELKNSITYFNEGNNLNGSVSTSIKFNNKIYSGSNVGVFYNNDYKLKNFNDNVSFNSIEGINTGVWDLKIINNQLYAATTSGLAKIDKNKSKYLYKGNIVFCMDHFDDFPGYLFLGMDNGFGVLDISKNGKNEFIRIPEVKGEVRSIANDRKGNFYLGTMYNGIIRIKFKNKTFQNFEKEVFDTSSGLPALDANFPYYLNNEIIVATSKGIYKMVSTGLQKPSIKYFFDSSFGKEMSKYAIDLIYYDADDYRYFTITNNGVYIIKKSDNSVIIDSTSLRKIPSIVSIFVEPDNSIWLSSTDGLYKTKLDKQTDKSVVNTIIREVIIGTDSSIYTENIKNLNKDNLNLDSVFECTAIEYKRNSLIFKYTLTSYEQSGKNQYRYFLEGFEKDWSGWNYSVFKEYTNLTEGDYVFHVKGMDFYGNIGKEASFYFSILPPWYRSTFAFILYFIILSGLVILIIVFNTRRLKAANVRLEGIIKQRTIEIQKQNENILKQNVEISKQKEEIVNQSVELERTNRELEKLSLVASETDNAVMIMDHNGYFEWVNNGFTRIYGYTFEDLTNRKLLTLTDINKHPIVFENLKVAIELKRSVNYETFIETLERNLWIQTTLTPIINEHNEVVKLVAIDSDISQIKLAEEEISMQKEELLAQSEQLEEANTELARKNQYITDSISYAKRIQLAMLPSFETIIEHFTELFIYFQPKDIVSGDFYWYSKQENYYFIAVADCTGHGVPGALMSMIGNTLLNSIVNERKVYSPSKILFYLNQGIINALNYEVELDENQEDGMDISICRIARDKNEITVSSANQSVFVIANNELKIIEGEYISIGSSDSSMSNAFFPEHVIKYGQDIIVYMLTDGLQDQFGGPDNRKFMISQFKKYIIENNSNPLIYQYEKLKQAFEKWKGYNKQIDDVLVLAFKLSNSPTQ